jgi:hypothetical protein
MDTMPANEDPIDTLSRQLSAEIAGRPAEHFDYQGISSDLAHACQSILAAIGKSTGTEKGYPHVLALTVVVSRGTWESIRYLYFEQPPDHGWRTEFVYSIPPLARTLLDSLYNIIFMFDNPGVNVHWFLLSGWVDQKRAYSRFQQKYGTDPKWKTWFDLCVADIKQTEDHLVKITDEERRSPDKPPLGYWPNPGKMGQKMQESDRAKFLEYVNDWFYGRLSGDSHLSLTGLLNRGGYCLQLAGGIDADALYAQTKAHFALTALTIYVALLSEICKELAPAADGARLRELWNKLVVWPDADELYKRRYEALLR